MNNPLKLSKTQISTLQDIREYGSLRTYNKRTLSALAKHNFIRTFGEDNSWVKITALGYNYLMDWC